MSDFAILKELGLSKTAIACYENLLEYGYGNVEQLAERLSLPRTGLYRVLKKLEKQGFVASVKSDLQPVYYYPEPLVRAMENHFAYQRKLVQPLLKPRPAQDRLEDYPRDC